MNPSNIQIVVSSYRRPPCSLLNEWLRQLPYLCGTWRTGSQEYGIDVARNQNVTRFLREDVPAGRTHLLMIDGDMVPLTPPYDLGQGLTGAILKEDGELLWCGYAGHQGRPGHAGEHDLGCGCVRISADLLKRIPAPWFATGYDEKMTKRVVCECSGFQQLAIQAGAENPRQVGVIGHQQGGDDGCVLVPTTDNKTGWRLFWPADLQESR